MNAFIEKSNNLFYSEDLPKNIDTHLRLIKSAENKKYNALYEQFKHNSCFFENLFENYNKTSKGEFFTPETVRDYLHHLVGDISNQTIIDYTCGTGSLLNGLKAEQVKGVELMRGSAEIAQWRGFDVEQGSAFDHKEKYDVAVLNPPFGIKGHTEVDFIEHALKYCQKVFAILPLGVLFADKFKGFRKIWTKHLKLVSVLPSNTFYNTNIPVCIIEIDQNIEVEKVVMVDASKHFNKVGKYNVMDKAAYSLNEFTGGLNRHFSDMVSVKWIEENDFNWSVSRYVYGESKPLLLSAAKVSLKSKVSKIELESNDVELLFFALRDATATFSEERILSERELLKLFVCYSAGVIFSDELMESEIDKYFSNYDEEIILKPIDSYTLHNLYV